MRGKARAVAGTSTSVVIAKWSLIVFAAAVLAFELWNADAPDVVFMAFASLPWFVGPAAVAALLVARAKSRVEAWLFVGAEAAAIASTAWLWTTLLFVKSGSQNAQNAIALLLLPLAQFAAVLAYALGVLAIAQFSQWTAPVSAPDTHALTDKESKGRIFSIAAIAICLFAILLAIHFLYN